MELYITNSDFQVEGVIDDVESILWQKKFNDIGECEIHSPYSEELHALLKRGNYVFRYDDDMACVITDIEITTDKEDGDYITATAKDVCTILSGRIVRWATVFSGSVAEFIGKLLDDNVVNANPASRSISQFSVDKSNFGALTATIEAKAQTEELLSLIIATCKSVGYGFRVSLDVGKGAFSFALYAGKNLSTGIGENYVEFSPKFSNILETNYKESNGNYKNIVYIGYEDFGGAFQLMSVYHGNTEPQGLERKEVYIDGTGTSREITFEELQAMYPDCVRIENTIWNDATMLFELAFVEVSGEGREQTEKITVTDVPYLRIIKRLGTEALSSYVETREFNGAVDTVDTYTYKADFDLGDIVLAANKFGISAPARIVEVMESEDNEDGYVVEPMFEFIN